MHVRWSFRDSAKDVFHDDSAIPHPTAIVYRLPPSQLILAIDLTFMLPSHPLMKMAKRKQTHQRLYLIRPV